MLFKFDLWLVDSFESFCHWWQKNISGEQDCFWWARQIIISFTACNVLSIVIISWYEYPFNPKFLKMIEELAFGEIALLLLMPLIGLQMIKETREEIDQMQQKGLANPYKYTSRVVRIICLFITLLASSMGLLILTVVTSRTPVFFLLGKSSSLFGISFAGYFISGNPLPSAKSKVHKWLKNLAESVKGLFVPTPQSVPVQVPSE